MNAPDNFNNDELSGNEPVSDTTAVNPIVSNPFGVAKPLAVASAESDVARAVTEVQAAMLIARRFPRDERAAMDKILNAFARPGLAEKAAYQYARGGSDIFGPSIRAAETIAQCWGNIYTGVRELEQRGGASTVEAFAWDTETGFHDVKVFQVQHVRHTRSGSYKLDDPRDIYEFVANAAARRKRACILAVIPSDVVESAMRQAEITLNTTAEATPEKIAALVKAFGEEFGVPKDALEKHIQRRMDAITPAQMVSMRRIYASLRDGMSRPEEWFEMTAPSGLSSGTPTGMSAGKAPKGTDALKAAKAKAAGSGQTINLSGAHIDPATSASGGAGGSARDAGAPAPIKSATDTGGAKVMPGETFMVQVGGNDLVPPPTLAEVIVAIGRAPDHDAVDLVLDSARGLTEPQQAAEIDVAARARRKILGDR